MRFFLFFILLFPILSLQSQDLYFNNGCNYSSDDTDGLISLLGSSTEAEKIINEIINAIPEYADQDYKFILRIASVANARAASQGGQRYILFNDEFMENFKLNAKTRWAAYSVFAHEVGHHVLKHDLASEDNAQRKQWEFDADYYSGRVLARLGATQYETLLGIRNFDVNEISETHPSPDEREIKVNEGFFNERKAMDQEIGTTTRTPAPSTPAPEKQTPSRTSVPSYPSDQEISPITPVGGEKFNIPLDKKRNRWNKVQKQEGEIDDEKIKLDAYLHPNFYRQDMRVCVLSENKNVAPEARMTGTINGTGHGIRLKYSPHQIVWSYRLEGFTQQEVTADKFRVVAYSTSLLPHEPKTGGWLGAYSTVAVGIAASAYGFTQRKKADNTYQVYAQNKDPNDVTYLEETRDKRYTRANDMHKKSQYINWAGAALFVGGGIWLYDKFRMRYTYKRDFCLLDHQMEWEPILAENVGVELGLRIWF